MVRLRRRDPAAAAGTDPPESRDVEVAVLDAAEAASGRRPEVVAAAEPVLVGAGPGAYRLELATDAEWDGPLLVRRADPAILAHEVGWMWAVAAVGYPVPRVLVDRTDQGLLVMQAPSGANLADCMVENFMALPRFLAAFGRLHARLHGLDVTAPAGPDDDPLDRLEARVAPTGPVRAAVTDELAWLADHRPRIAGPAGHVVCHGELHPLHVYVDDGDASKAVVVNWTRARRADPAYDVAATITGFWSLPFFVPGAVQRSVLKTARESLISAYLQAYREAAVRPLDDDALRYWQAYHLCWLAGDLARSIHHGPVDAWDPTTNAAQPTRSLTETRRQFHAVAEGGP